MWAYGHFTNNGLCPIYFTQMVKPPINPTNIKGTQNHVSTPGFLSPDAYYAIPRNPRNIVFARHNRLISQHIIHYIP
jgi:hypothetical protein